VSFGKDSPVNILGSLFGLMVASLMIALAPVTAVAREARPAHHLQERVPLKLAAAYGALALTAERIAQAWWTAAGQTDAQHTDFSSPGRKPHHEFDRQPGSEVRRTRNDQTYLKGECTILRTDANVDEIAADMLRVGSLTSEERAEIWRGLRRQATETSVPAGLRVGEMVPSTIHLLSFVDDLRKKIPAIGPYCYALLHGQVLIIDQRSGTIVSIVTE
jgi:hypothetical protein